MEFIGNIQDLKLTPLSSGDENNNAIISWLNSNDIAKSKAINTYIKDINTNPTDELVNIIFNDIITDDLYRRCLLMLTFYDAIEELTGTRPIIDNPKALLFALLVNLNAKNGANRIKSVGALMAAEEISPELDYRQYIQNGGGEDSKFKNEYKTIRISKNEVSSEIILELPIIKSFLGIYTFATDAKPAAKLSFSEDNSNETLNIPANIWMSMIQAELNKRKSIRFSPFDMGRLSEIVQFSIKNLEDIMRVNDMHVIFDFPSIFDYEFQDGKLILNNTKEPPEIDDNGRDEDDANKPLKWVKYGGSTTRKKLSYKNNKFYFVVGGGQIIKIWANA